MNRFLRYQFRSIYMTRKLKPRVHLLLFRVEARPRSANRSIVSAPAPPRPFSGFSLRKSDLSQTMRPLSASQTQSRAPSQLSFRPPSAPKVLYCLFAFSLARIS